MNKDKFSPPEPTHGDSTHSAIKMALSAIPHVGGASAELFHHLVTPPLERRREEWMRLVGETLNELNGIDYSELVSNEEFVSVIIEATIAATKTANNDKRRLLCNAIRKAAQGILPIMDWSVVFIRYVDELTYEHVLLLSAMCGRPEALVTIKSYGELMDEYGPSVGTEIQRDHFKYLCSDLSNKGLIRLSADIDDFDDVYEASSLLMADTNDALPRVKITGMGNAFIDWVVN